MRCLLLWWCAALLIAADFVTVRDGYLVDPTTDATWIPRGFAYQTWNRFVFADQTFSQLDDDFAAMAAHGADSLRVELTWGDIEIGDGVYDWKRADYLIDAARRHRLRLLVLIGYQYAPAWVVRKRPDLLAIHHDPVAGTKGTSALLNYEHPEARSLYARFLAAVCGRYRDAREVTAWIIGNEFAYYDLWEDPVLFPQKRYVGFDAAYSLPSWVEFLRGRYGSIHLLNSTWGTDWPDFPDVPMATGYPRNRSDHAAMRRSGWYDLLAWRGASISRFLATGAAAARTADPNHLLTYAQVGGIFSGFDCNITGEDPTGIVAACAAAGAPLGFWTINNYPFVASGAELRSLAYGMAKHRAQVGLPVLVTETGVSSTDVLFTEAQARAEAVIPSLIWETLAAGGIGVHLFHWNDRDEFLTQPFPFAREAGFGVVGWKRQPKPALAAVAAAFRRMDEVDFAAQVAGSRPAPRDVAVWWSRDQDTTWNRVNQELGYLWSAFQRAGLHPGIVGDAEIAAGEVLGARALVVVRAEQLSQAHRDRLEALVEGGLHLFAEGDLPGRFDASSKPVPGWSEAMRRLFGLETATGTVAFEGWAVPAGSSGVDFNGNYTPVTLRIDAPVAWLAPGGPDLGFAAWKHWTGLTASAGSTRLSSGGSPVLHLHQKGLGRTAICTAPIGDFNGTAETPLSAYDLRRSIVTAAVIDHLGIAPSLTISGLGSGEIVRDTWLSDDGSALIFLQNIASSSAAVTVTSSRIDNRQVEDLVTGNPVARAGDGPPTATIPGDGIAIWRVHPAGEAPPRIWFTGCPLRICAGDPAGAVISAAADGVVGATIRGELLVDGRVRSSTSGPVGTLTVPLPGPDLGDPSYRATAHGGRASLRVTVLDPAGVAQATAERPVVLAMPVLPAERPAAPTAGPQTVQLLFQGLTNDDGTNLSREPVWLGREPAAPWRLRLVAVDAAGSEVATSDLTAARSAGSGQAVITIPTGAVGLHWRAEAITSGNRVAARWDDATTSRPIDPANLAPVITASAAPMSSDPTRWALSATIADDGRPGPAVRVAWVVTSGPGTAAIADAGVAVTEALFSEPGTYQVRVSADDGQLRAAAQFAVVVGEGQDDQSGLVARWRFTPLAGDPMPALGDRSGHGHDGILLRGSLGLGGLEGSALPVAVTVADAADLRLFAAPTTSAAADIRIGEGRATICAWIACDPQSSQPDQVILSKKETWDAPAGWELLYQHQEGKLKFLGSESGPFVEAATGVLTAGWHHVAVAMQDTSASVWLDGRQVAAGTIRGIWPGDAPLTIGGTSGDPARSFRGSVASAEIYRRKLASAEIAALATKAPNLPAPAATTGEPPAKTCGGGTGPALLLGCFLFAFMRRRTRG
ncbi:hypothetical protein LBMAG53_28520 [Planctomycetota bacterium]|nr:hypothetical protein LBMAG53_28520 [Planctomycetota bacterium]